MIYDMIYPFNIGGGESRYFFLAKELIKRGHEPYMGYRALPGGRIQLEETIEDAVIREAKEETGIDMVPGGFEERMIYPARSLYVEYRWGVVENCRSTIEGELAVNMDEAACNYAILLILLQKIHLLMEVPGCPKVVTIAERNVCA